MVDIARYYARKLWELIVLVALWSYAGYLALHVLTHGLV